MRIADAKGHSEILEGPGSNRVSFKIGEGLFQLLSAHILIGRPLDGCSNNREGILLSALIGPFLCPKTKMCNTPILCSKILHENK